MNRQQMIKKIEALNALPTLPVVAMEVNRMLQDIEAPIERLVEVLERDQAMVVKILRLVNSSFFGFKNRVTSLRHAITLLGYGTVQSAVVTVTVIDCLKLKQAFNGFDIVSFWSHAIGVAVMSRHLAAQTKLCVPEEAFTAGLLHDIGKIILINVFPDIAIDILKTISMGEETFYQAEQHMGIWPHARIGSFLARRWMLPGVFENTIKNHHGPTGANDADPLADLVRVADTLVNIMEGRPGYRLDTDSLTPSTREPMVAVLKDAETWFPYLKTEMASATDFFSKG